MKIERTIIAALFFALVIKMFFFDFTIVEGSSMQPSLKNGTVLIVNRLNYGFRPFMISRYLVHWASPQVGDVVVFFTPLGDIAVKRCSAVLHEDDKIFFTALGDNSLESFDSRSYGNVPIDNLIGRALWVK
ncbi:MAG: signal peptidase I [Termitinemataceae bacterium]|nr:MAG: signal peptidase I [Termitinemataceae bacterium]